VLPFPLGTSFVSGQPVYFPFQGQARGRACYAAKYRQVYRGRTHGIEETAAETYLLFVGAEGGAEPDTTGTPTTTGTTLPLTASLSDGTYRFVLQRRNKYRVTSGNLTSTLVRISGGTLTSLLPGAVSESAVSVVGWNAVITANYQDLARPANRFRIVVSQATTVIPANPYVQTSYVTMDQGDGIAKLETIIALQDTTALPLQTGAVSVAIRAEFFTAPSTVRAGPETTIETTAPGTTYAAAEGHLVDILSGTTHWERTT
jgi:hypothetical protein